MASSGADSGRQPGAFSKFSLGDELGRGGMGTVRLAEDRELQRELAIKLLRDADNPDAVEQFVEEAQITAQLEHPNIVPVHELGRDTKGRPWLAMKRIEGDSLAEVIAEWKRFGRKGRLKQEDYNTILGIFGKVCDAVAFAHSRGVIHRDIKPQNIMVGAFGEVLLVDWGLAKPLDKDAPVRPVRSARRASGSNITLDGEVFGTPAYMPPEQADGRIEEIDERSDIFALGGVLYCMLTLEPPYRGRNATDTVTQAARHQLVPPRQRTPGHGIPRELQAIILKAMASDQADRHQLVRDLQADLSAWQTHQRTSAWRASPFARAIKWTRRHPTAAQTSAVVLIGALTISMLVVQLNATRTARKLAEQQLRTESLQRELAEQQAEAQRSRAESAEDQVEDLGGKLEDLLDEQSRESIAAFERRWYRAKANGVPDESFGATLSETDTRRFLHAYDALFDVYAILHRSPPAGRCYERGLILFFAGRMGEARADFDATLRADPEHPGAWVNRGVLHRAAGRLEEALADFNEALRINPEVSDAWTNRGAVRFSLGRVEEAIADYTTALRLNRADTTAYCNRGYAHYKQGRFREALADFEAALRINTRIPHAYNNRGLVRMDQGHLDEALADFDTALRLSPRMAEAVCNRGAVRRQQGRFEEALADYRKALEFDPQYVGAYVHRGNTMLELGRVDEAIADYESAMEIGGRAAEALNGRATALKLQDRVDEALADYTAAIAEAPTVPEYRYNRALAFGVAGRLDEAVADYDEVLRLNPKHASALANRGSLRMRLGQEDAALDDFNAALRIDETMWQPRVNRGLIHAAHNRVTDALESFEAGYRLCPDPIAREQIAALLRQFGGRVPE